MSNIPTRYKEIRNFIEGLHTSNILLGSKSTIAFLNHDNYWSSHVTLNNNGKIETFSVRYMKNKNEVWVVTNFYSFLPEYDKWLMNTIGYELSKQNILFEIESQKPSYWGKNIFVKARLDKNKDYTKVYDLYMLYKSYKDRMEDEVII